MLLFSCSSFQNLFGDLFRHGRMV